MARARFPLTPSLSPGERENLRQSVGEAEAVGICANCALGFPLPKGGQGRGAAFGARPFSKPLSPEARLLWPTDWCLDASLARKGPRLAEAAGEWPYLCQKSK
jgi:hypothetical protein